MHISHDPPLYSPSNPVSAMCLAPSARTGEKTLPLRPTLVTCLFVALGLVSHLPGRSYDELRLTPLQLGCLVGLTMSCERLVWCLYGDVGCLSGEGMVGANRSVALCYVLAVGCEVGSRKRPLARCYVSGGMAHHDGWVASALARANHSGSSTAPRPEVWSLSIASQDEAAWVRRRSCQLLLYRIRA